MRAAQPARKVKTMHKTLTVVKKPLFCIAAVAELVVYLMSFEIAGVPPLKKILSSSPVIV